MVMVFDVTPGDMSLVFIIVGLHRQPFARASNSISPPTSPPRGGIDGRGGDRTPRLAVFMRAGGDR
jgi:hypothetical protein